MALLYHPALLRMLAAIGALGASHALLGGGSLLRLSSCVFLLTVPGFHALATLKPWLKRWGLLLPEGARRQLARIGPAELLPLLAAVLVGLGLHLLGALGEGGVDALAVALCAASSAVLLLSLWFQLHWLWAAARFLFPYLTWSGPEPEAGCQYVDGESGKPLIALSIDDVPCTHEKFGISDIEACLELLEKHGARATLFVMSRELHKHNEHRDISSVLASAVSRGHELGNHDLLDVKTALRSNEDFTAALRECDDQLRELVGRAGRQWRGWRDFVGGDARAGTPALPDAAREGPERGGGGPGPGGCATGAHPETLACQSEYRDPLVLASQGEPIKWFRPGGGFFRREMVSIAARHGYSTALGNCFPIDTHMPQSHNVWYLRLRAAPGKIIIIHDRPKLRPTLEAVLPELCERYQVVTLSALFRAAAEAQRKDGPAPEKGAPSASRPPPGPMAIGKYTCLPRTET